MITEISATKEELNRLSGTVISCAIEVHRHMGPGLLESIYQHCMIHELRSRELRVDQNVPMKLQYKSRLIDKEFFIDLLVENEIVVELKAVESIINVHEAQLLSYLKLANKRVGLLINFNEALLKDGITRMVYKY